MKRLSYTCHMQDNKIGLNLKHNKLCTFRLLSDEFTSRLIIIINSKPLQYATNKSCLRRFASYTCCFKLHNFLGITKDNLIQRSTTVESTISGNPWNHWKVSSKVKVSINGRLKIQCMYVTGNMTQCSLMGAVC